MKPTMKTKLLSLLFIFLSGTILAQGVVRGRIFNPVNNEPVAFANVLISWKAN